MEGDTSACDQEVAEIVSAAEDGTIGDNEHHRSQEKEIQRASQLCQNELFSSENVATTDVASELPSLITKLKSSDDQQSSGSSSSGNGSIKSGSGSPRQQQNVGHTKSESIRKDSEVSSSQQRSTGEADTTNIRLKLGGFSGRSSRKGSSCSTPVSNLRTEMDYPSPNFIRPQQFSSKCHEVQVDEASKLTVRLHYNPVMDEWLSLTEEVAPKQLEDSDILFDLHKVEGPCTTEANEEIIKIGPFLDSLESTGIRRNDVRLEAMLKTFKQHKKDRGLSHINNLELGRNQFKEAVSKCVTLLSRAFKGKFVIPEFEHFSKQITDIYNSCKSNEAGQVASYIPQLARYNPEYWGVSICTVDGQRFSIGDTNIPFTLQSSSKPFTYAVCLNELGTKTVHEYVGQEPSGRMFNELSLSSNNKPHNPLLNSGAIMSCAMLLSLVKPEMKISEKFDFVMEYLKKIGGGEFMSFNNSIFLSERETADRNFALAYYMKENKCFPKGFVLQECLDFYFQTCSMEVNCETLAVMGATLANGGMCPTTGEVALNPGAVRDALSLMHSCGMYNYSGQFAFDVGLPSKSGVSGALVLVVPNVMGIGLWSPPLDSLGNTVRGVQFSKSLIKSFNFHRFDNLIRNGCKSDPRKFRNEHLRQSTLCLLYSACTGDLTALKRFYYSGIDMSSSNYDGRTALHLAAAEGHSSCIKFLVETCKLSPLTKDRWGFTPLIEAERFHHDFVFRYLAKHIEDNYPEALESLLKEHDEQKSNNNKKS